MSEFISRQCAKWVNQKEGTVKVLAFEGSFTGEDRKKGPLEKSNLHRIIIKANQKDSTGTISLIGNIPVEKLPTIKELSKNALIDKSCKNGECAFSILTDEFKPITGNKDEKGNPLVYSIDVKYCGKMGLPIIVTVTNLRCPVDFTSDGKTLVKLKEAYDKKEVKLFISTSDWYNGICAAEDAYKLYLQRAAQIGTYDGALGLL